MRTLQVSSSPGVREEFAFIGLKCFQNFLVDMRHFVPLNLQQLSAPLHRPSLHFDDLLIFKLFRILGSSRSSGLKKQTLANGAAFKLRLSMRLLSLPRYKSRLSLALSTN
jgi:hypothetical protein